MFYYNIKTQHIKQGGAANFWLVNQRPASQLLLRLLRYEGWTAWFWLINKVGLFSLCTLGLQGLQWFRLRPQVKVGLQALNGSSKGVGL